MTPISHRTASALGSVPARRAVTFCRRSLRARSEEVGRTSPGGQAVGGSLNGLRASFVA